jgi:hypothetical protein
MQLRLYRVIQSSSTILKEAAGIGMQRWLKSVDDGLKSQPRKFCKYVYNSENKA